MNINDIANWMEEAAAAAKRGMNTAKDEQFKSLWAKRYGVIIEAQAKLRRHGTTDIETFLQYLDDQEKKKGAK